MRRRDRPLSVVARDRPDSFHRALGAFDFTLLVIGAAIGADVYIVASLAAGYLGPAQLVAWVGGGLLAALIVLPFIQCACIDPEVGGTYAYVRRAFGPLAGFTAGWAMYLGDAVFLPIFPTAFANYLTYFVPYLSDGGRLASQVGLVAIVTLVNIFGVRASGHLNDLLTVAKLVPLAILVVVGLAVVVVRPGVALAHLTPFTPLGWSGFGPAVLLIFFAYAGFELAVLPAGEVTEPARTMPRGLVVGMGVVTLFYLLTALTVSVGLPWQEAAGSTRPLADAFDGLSAEIGWTAIPGGLLMALGGLVSIGATFDVFMLSVARLSYAMAADGLLPSPLAQVHPRFATPYVALVVQALFSLLVGRLLDISHLIDAGMFLVGLCYAATALAALRLVAKSDAQRLPVPGLRVWLALASVAGLYLSFQAPSELKLIGMAGVTVGLVGYGLRLIARGWEPLPVLIAHEEAKFVQWARQYELWLMATVRRLSHR